MKRLPLIILITLIFLLSLYLFVFLSPAEAFQASGPRILPLSPLHF